MSCPMRKLSRGNVAVLLLVFILVADQVSKILVKTNMTIHESIEIFSWFKILFIENNGMAYGMEIGSKLLLSLMRVLLIGVLSVYLVREIKEKARWGYIVCLVMVVAGAIGNMIDGMFYGLIFDESTPYTVSELVPFGSGYSSFMTGKVVDMLYFPIINTTWPEWVPMVGGEGFIFFSPIFNIADSSISVGVVALLIWYRKELAELSVEKILGRKKNDSLQKTEDK
ncbi:MAG: lipoprotein signal peptidase [Prevotellaceae bacterium]|nr:lipoprotein signal peptidase [Prevotellaceae bacterium]